TSSIPLFYSAPPTAWLSTLSLHDALPILQVHRVDLLALIEETEPDALADLRRERRGRGESLAIERETAQLLVQDDDLFLVVSRVDAAVLRRHDQRSEHPASDLLGRVVM